MNEEEMVSANVGLEAIRAPVEITAAEALELVLPEINAMPDKGLPRINFDVAACVVLVLLRLPGILRHRKSISATFKNFDLKNVDRLELYARAARAAQMNYLTNPRPLHPARELATELFRVRKRWLRDLRSLVERGLLQASVLHGVKGGKRDKDLGHDVLLLGRAIREHDEVTGTVFPGPEVGAIEAKAVRLLELVIVRDHTPVTRCQLRLRRQKAVALLVRAYTEVRRALSYLRWFEGDAAEIAPAFPARHGRRKAAEKKKSAGFTLSANKVLPT